MTLDTRSGLPRSFAWLIAAQFTSALADNALLIVAIASLVERREPAWWAPLLKLAFTLAYVLLAPGVGALADAGSKARLMAWMNLLKMLGVALLLFGLHPVAAYAVVGLGAAAYAPAKYGLVTELVPPQALVRANGWIEVSVVCAALLGTVLGGALVSPLWAAFAQRALDSFGADAGWPGPGSTGLRVALGSLLGVYALAAALQWGVPDSGARYARLLPHPRHLWRNFWRANRRLWRDTEGGLSLAVTTLFWGVGATLQFVVLRWATQALGLGLDRAAYLQAVVAVGVVLGAGLAGRFVGLAQARKVLPAGVVLGLLIAATSHLHRLDGVWLALIVTGAVGGWLVVPMNALLQHRGHALLTAGRSIAVQGYNENLSILVMLAVYAGLVSLDWPIRGIMLGLGLAIAGAMGLLIWRTRAAAPGSESVKPAGSS